LTILTLGAAVQSLIVPDRAGKPADMVRRSAALPSTWRGRRTVLRQAQHERI
jgi:hypothetical protein